MIVVMQGKWARIAEVRGHRKVGSTFSVTCRACRRPLATTNDPTWAREVYDKHESGDHR